MKDNGIWLGLVIAILIITLGMLQGVALADAQYTVTVDDWCNIREEPRKDSADAGDLYAGDTVIGTDYTDGWVRITREIVDGMDCAIGVEAGEGWVRADLLTLKDYPTGRYSNNTGGRVRLRTAPDGKTIDWLDAGHGVDVIRWVDVDGTAWAYTAKGYVDGGCLEVAK